VSDGKIVVTALLIEPAARTPHERHKAIRELPLQDIVSCIMERAKLEMAKSEGTRRIDAHRGRAHTKSELRTVAAAYIEAYGRGVPVQQAVAESLGIARSTAEKRIMAARAAGLIPKGMNRRPRTRTRKNP